MQKQEKEDPRPYAAGSSFFRKGLMKQLSIMIKPASSLCNLRCGYCFYADVTNLREVRSYGIMQEDTLRKMLQNIRAGLSPKDRVTFAFQGGEPLLAGLDYYRRFTEITGAWKDISISYAIQTNGTLLDDEWCRFLSEHRFLAGISLDLHKTSHNAARRDAEGNGTWNRVMDAVSLFRKHHVEFNVLCTLTREVARYPGKVWRTIEKEDFRYVQFTPCLDDLDAAGKSSGPEGPDKEKHSSYALTLVAFADFYREIFRYWLPEFEKGNYYSIKLFDDIVDQLAFGIISSCGLNGICQPQLVVEADGSVYPCDFYCLDEYRLGNLTEDSLEQLYLASAASPSHARQALTEYCAACPYVSLCGSGCKRMRREVFYSPETAKCGYRAFLDEALPDLVRIARQRRITGS